MRYSKESKEVKCAACGRENGIIKVLDMIVCEKCNDYINKARAFYGER